MSGDNNCEACGGVGWLLRDDATHGLHVERCATCDVFPDDDAAANAARPVLQAALEAEKKERDASQYQINGVLEVHADRGVLYFHSDEGYTALRMSGLPQPIPRPSIEKRMLDITHMVGCDWDGKTKWQQDDEFRAKQDTMVTCLFCDKEVPMKTAHRYQERWVGDECCWDERLRVTE